MLESLHALPAVGDRRFGAVSIGYDKITTIRGELQTLAALAALVMGVDAEKLTMHDVAGFLNNVQAALGTADVETLPTPESPRAAVLAWALATAAIKA